MVEIKGQDMTNQIKLSVEYGNERNTEFLLCDQCTESSGCDRTTDCRAATEIRTAMNPNNTLKGPGKILVVVPPGCCYDSTQEFLFGILRKYNGWEK